MAHPAAQKNCHEGGGEARERREKADFLPKIGLLLTKYWLFLMGYNWRFQKYFENSEAFSLFLSQY